MASGLSLLAVVSYGQVKSSAFRLMLKSLLHHDVREIGVQEAARDSASIVFLDAREPAEYQVSHLRGAIFTGYEQFNPDSVPIMDKNRRIVVYCSVGYRSEKVTEQLRAAGYSNVSNLYGGLFEWVNQGLPVYNDQGLTNAVHAYSRSWGVWLRKGRKVYKSR